MHILIVDPSEYITESIESLLIEEDQSAVVYKTNSFSDAISIYENVKPQVVLMGRTIPDYKAIVLLKDILKSAHRAKIILMSYNSDAFIKEQWKNHGIEFFVDKYYDFELIPELVKKLTQK